MQVQHAMTKVIVSVGPRHTLAQAVVKMVESNVGAAVVIDPDNEAAQIITERDVMKAIAAGVDIKTGLVQAHVCTNSRYAEPEWLLDEAALLMVKIGVRHLVVIDHSGEVAGMLSMRDIVRCQVSAVS